MDYNEVWFSESTFHEKAKKKITVCFLRRFQKSKNIARIMSYSGTIWRNVNVASFFPPIMGLTYDLKYWYMHMWMPHIGEHLYGCIPCGWTSVWVNVCMGEFSYWWMYIFVNVWLVNFILGWFHDKTRRKKVNFKKLHFYEEIWMNIGYPYDFLML